MLVLPKVNRDQDPLISDGERCAVFGCEVSWTMLRITDSGFRIGYCADHYRQANRLFGNRKKAAA